MVFEEENWKSIEDAFLKEDLIALRLFLQTFSVMLRLKFWIKYKTVAVLPSTFAIRKKGLKHSIDSDGLIYQVCSQYY